MLEPIKPCFWNIILLKRVEIILGPFQIVHKTHLLTLAVNYQKCTTLNNKKINLIVGIYIC
jgi:hypothetical protein